MLDVGLTEVEVDFIRANLDADVTKMLLAKTPPGLHAQKMAEQIRARQKAKTKLPTWYANAQLVFPASLSVEQASSELTAQYKASLIDSEVVIDLTGGMGVDTCAFAGAARRVVYVERDAALAQTAAHNFETLKLTNVEVRHGMAFEQTFNEADAPETTIYLDPHRRGNANQKLVRMADYEPSVGQHLGVLLQYARRVIVKVSPLIDLTQAQRDLSGHVVQIHVVAVDNEVKEVLLLIEPIAKIVLFVAVNLSTTHPTSVFCFDPAHEKTASVAFSVPLQYLYEPNAAMLKAGAFKTTAERFGVFKIGLHSHLYTSQNLVANFAGRIFEVMAVCRADKKEVQTHLPNGKAHLTTRNFPMKTEDLKQKLGLKDGGDTYLLATTLHNGDKRVIVTKKITNPHVF